MNVALRVALALPLLACSVEDGAPAEEARPPAAVDALPGDPFDLPVGETATIGPGGFRVTFDAVVEDARCAEGASCPTAGNAAVRLAIEAGEGTATLVLNTDRPPREAGVLGHRVSLRDLAPAPEAGGDTVRAGPDPEAYVATLVVEEAP